MLDHEKSLDFYRKHSRFHQIKPYLIRQLHEFKVFVGLRHEPAGEGYNGAAGYGYTVQHGLVVEETLHKWLTLETHNSYSESINRNNSINSNIPKNRFMTSSSLHFH